MPASIRLAHQRYTDPSNDRQSRLKMWVASCEGIDPNIFLYVRDVPVPDQPQSMVDSYLNVCTPADMAEFSATEPASGEELFRLSSIDMLFRSVDALELMVGAVNAQTALLLEGVNALDSVSSQTIYTLDLPGGASSSMAPSSSSSSSSSSSQPPP